MLKVLYHYILARIHFNYFHHVRRLKALSRSSDEDTSVGAKMALVKLGVRSPEWTGYE